MSKYIRNRQRIRIEKREWYDFLQHDISPLFKPDPRDSRLIGHMLRLEATPQAIQTFADECHAMTDYGYWFLLGVLWVSYTGWSKLELWKHLFRADRPNRDSCLMKPTESRHFRALPKEVHCYRVHRPNEQEWISYTLDMDVARLYTRFRDVTQVHEYRIPRKHLLCLFLRRGEYEVLCLDKGRAKLVTVHEWRNAA